MQEIPQSVSWEFGFQTSIHGSDAATLIQLRILTLLALAFRYIRFNSGFGVPDFFR